MQGLLIMSKQDASAPSAVEVTAQDLPLYCPNPAMPLWSSHPRVFLDVAATGEAMCPYCGTRYRVSGEAPRGAH
jgi:uncharacterized Zn-finger protein